MRGNAHGLQRDNLLRLFSCSTKRISQKNKDDPPTTEGSLAMSAMSTPTLRRIKRRQLRTSFSHPRLPLPIRPPTPIPGYDPQDVTAVTCDGGTESIHSNEVEASTSLPFCFGNAKTLEDSFPSILRILDSLGRAYHGNDAPAFCALAGVFATVVLDVASCIVASELVDPTGEQFTLAKSIFHLLLNTFVSTTNRVGDYKFHRCHHRHPEMRSAFEYAQMVHESLALLYRSGLGKPPKNKSLPPLPLSQVFQLPHPLGTSAARSNVTVNKSGRPVHVHGQSEDLSQCNGENGSTLPSDGPRLDNYNQRYTALFFVEGRIPSTFSGVDERCEDLKLNKSSKVQAVSVSFLISIITSGEGTTDLGLIQAILACFRLFITPSEFFQELKDRFELQPPTNSKDASGGETKISNIRANVLAVIYSWLDQHWQVNSDSVVLGGIRAFVEEQSRNGSQLNILLAKIRVREECSEASIFDERRRHIASTSPARTSPPDCTKFNFPHSFHASSDGLLQLDTDGGREELSRHLILKMSHLYRQLDPNKIVRFWYKEGEACRDYDKFKDEPGVNELAAISTYGEQLTLWIISSILEINDTKRRANRLELWVDVASRCMAHCDYATANNIYVSLSYSAVIRLKKTILAIPYAPKVQYKKLEKFFQDERMFRDTFNDLRPSLPSSTAPLIRDIIHAKKGIEKDKTWSQESATNTSNTTPKQKFISLDKCRVLQQATRVLNKALMEYKFHENKDLSQWLDGRLKEYHTNDTKIVYEELQQASYERESTQTNLRQFANPWKYSSSKPSNPSKGNVARLSSGVKQSMEEKKKADAFFALFKALAFG